MELIHKTMLIALGIAHWIFLPPTVNALKNLYQMRKEIRPSELI